MLCTPDFSSNSDFKRWEVKLTPNSSIEDEGQIC